MANLNKKILFVVEGQRGEKPIVKTIESILSDAAHPIEIVVFKTTIYELYQPLKSGDYDSLVRYLMVTNKLKVEKYVKPEALFSAIYLVFDFEPHYHKFSKEIISWCQEFFNDETNNGKLYINYPMIEAIYDIDGWNDTQVKTQLLINFRGSEYKREVRQRTMIANPMTGHMYSKKLPNDVYKKIAKMMKVRYDYLLSMHRLRTNGEICHQDVLEIQLMAFEKKQVFIIAMIALFLYDYNPDLLD